VRIQIISGGVYGGNGVELAVGEELDVKEEPTGWAGRYRVISDEKGKTAATGEEVDPDAFDPDKATVPQLKEWLEANSVPIAGDEKKAELVEMAKAKIAEQA